MKSHLINLGYILSAGLLITFVLFGLSLKNDKTETTLKEKELLIEKLKVQNQKPGAFILLDEDVTSVTFQDFEGEITWYQTYDLENTQPEYTSVNFYPIKDEKIISGKILNVPSNAYAFLVKGKMDGDTYSIAYSHK